MSRRDQSEPRILLERGSAPPCPASDYMERRWWEARFDVECDFAERFDDEARLRGYGATEQAAIDDLRRKAREHLR